ncbi:MAG: OmpA family protein, partial [bacterium]
MPRKISGYALLLPAFLVLVMMSPESGITAAGAGNEPALSVPAHWNSSRASDAERSMLQRLLQRLRKDSSLTLLVTGYTDTLGSSGENEAIGFYYASSVAHQLEEDYGFPRDRIEVLSGGETEPIVPSGSFEDQVRNRRVVISLGVPQTVEVPLKKIPSPAESKRVLILEPVSGTVERSYQRVKALIEGGSRTALLTVNGISSLIAVQDSRIDTGIVLERGENSIEVMAWDDSGAFGRDSVNVLYRPPPPEIEIVSPRDGETFETTHSPVIEVIGTVRSETPLAEAYLFLNGAPRRIEVDQGGRFSQPVVLIRQTNRIRVEAPEPLEQEPAPSVVDIHHLADPVTRQGESGDAGSLDEGRSRYEEVLLD